MSTEPSGFSLMNTAIGTPQARWREITQSGRDSIMPLMRFSPCGGTHCVSRIACMARARSVSPGLSIALSMAMNHCGVLRKMIGFFERHECGYWCLRRPRAMMHAGFDQRLDHRVVGVALLALVVDDALADEAGHGIGEGAVLVDGVGNRGIDAARFQRGAIGGPDLEVLAAVSGRGVHEARAGVVGDVIAFQ